MAEVIAVELGVHDESKGNHSLLDLLRQGRREEALEKARQAEDVNQYDDGSTPLLIATTRGWGDVVEALVRNGANVNSISDLGETPLMRAIKSGKIDPYVIKLILEHGGKETLNHAAKEEAFFSKWTALHFACDSSMNTHAVIIAILISYGASVKLVASNGKTPEDMCGNNPEFLKAIHKPYDVVKHYDFGVHISENNDTQESIEEHERSEGSDASRGSLLRVGLNMFRKHSSAAPVQGKKGSLIEN